MGFLNNLMGIKEDSASGGSLANCADGGHNLDRSKILQATDEMALTPKNPGNFKGIRSIPVLTQPRYFTREEAQALADRAKEAKEGVRHTKRAIKALGKIDDCDRKVNNQYYYKYAPKIARNELSKKKAMVSYAKDQHSLRPAYAALGVGLEKAENNAEQRISAIAASLS